MKVVNRTPSATADVSSARGTAFRELRQLVLLAIALFVVLFVCIGLVTDLVVSRISFEAEATLFGAFTPGGDDARADSEELARLRPILSALRKDPSVPPLPYRLTVIARDRPNAFAFPGGTIGVTSGLLASLDQDIELAFVLGHELGHFHSRDHLRGIGRAVGLGVAYAVLFGGDLGSDTLGRILQHVLQRSYSRGQEVRADRFGVALVHRVYGDTGGVDRLFELLSEEQHLPGWAYMFSTHPSPEARVEDLRAYAATLGGAGGEGRVRGARGQ